MLIGGKKYLSKGLVSHLMIFCSALTNVTQNICSEKCTPTSKEALFVCPLIFLPKNSGSKPIGVGATLRRKIEKVVVSAIKK